MIHLNDSKLQSLICVYPPSEVSHRIQIRMLFPEYFGLFQFGRNGMQKRSGNRKDERNNNNND